MAQRIVLVDDLDGTAEDAKQGITVETLTFGWRGDTYEIDLTELHGMQFADIMVPYLAHGRLVERAPKGKKSPAAAKVTTDANGRSHVHNEAAMPRAWGSRSKEVRAWAKENGVACPPTGRIPRAVAEAYEKAHPEEASRGAA